MVKLENIGSEAYQRHVVTFEESEVVIGLRFHPTVAMWTIDVEYKGIQALGYKLSVNVLHMRSRNYPFDFIVVDNSGNDLDPFRLDDFTVGRCNLYMLGSDDMEGIRNAPVPL